MKDERFSKLKFPIHTLPEGKSVLEALPILKTYKAFDMYKGKYKDQVIKYVIYLYDKNSDLIEEYPDIRDRKEEAARLAGFEMKTKYQDSRPVTFWPEPISFAMNGRFDHDQGVGIFKMIIAYLMMQNNAAWTELSVLEQEYQEYIELRFKGITGEKDKEVIEAATKKDKLREACQLMVDKIKSYQDQLFGDNEDVSDQTTQLRLTKPEQLHRMLKRV